MGYESKLIIVEGYPTKQKSYEKTYSNKIMEIDLCKAGYDGFFSKLLQKSEETEYYYFADDGNKKIIKDLYDEPLKELPLKELINALEKDYEDTNYRRFYIAIKALKSFKKNDWPYLHVLHFGH